jgi:hypothetical protein
MGGAIVAAVYVATVLFLLTLFFKLTFDVAAIRRMLENTGLFSGIPCPSCAMPIPPDARVCGHCGRDAEVHVPRP